MQTPSEFYRPTAVLLALALIGCTGDDELAHDDEAELDTNSVETTSATTTTTSGGPDTSTDGTESTDSTGMDTSATDDACPLNDHWEPNADAKQPCKMTWQSVSEYSAARLIDDAYLCPGEGDWYHFDVASLGYTEHFVYLRALVEDAGLCGAICDEPVIPAGPEYALTLEVYRADDMKLLLSSTQQDGVLPLGGFGDDYAHQLLIHVSSPNPKAEYSYRLSVEVRNYDGEDECEC